jgi:hypothetical protein
MILSPLLLGAAITCVNQFLAVQNYNADTSVSKRKQMLMFEDADKTMCDHASRGARHHIL